MTFINVVKSIAFLGGEMLLLLWYRIKYERVFFSSFIYIYIYYYSSSEYSDKYYWLSTFVFVGIVCTDIYYSDYLDRTDGSNAHHFLFLSFPPLYFIILLFIYHFSLAVMVRCLEIIIKKKKKRMRIRTNDGTVRSQ